MDSVIVAYVYKRAVGSWQGRKMSAGAGGGQRPDEEDSSLSYEDQ